MSYQSCSVIVCVVLGRPPGSYTQYHHLFMNLTVSFFLVPHRRHTRYYGGYHSNHRVVNWLWDVLEKEFSEEEKSRFLKVPYLIWICHTFPPYFPAFDKPVHNCGHSKSRRGLTRCCLFKLMRNNRTTKIFLSLVMFATSSEAPLKGRYH